LYYGSYLILNDKHELTKGRLSSYALCAVYMIEAISTLFSTMNEFISGAAVAENLFNMLVFLNFFFFIKNLYLFNH